VSSSKRNLIVVVVVCFNSDLSDNKVSYIEPGAFLPLTHLRTLYVDFFGHLLTQKTSPTNDSSPLSYFVDFVEYSYFDDW